MSPRVQAAFGYQTDKNISFLLELPGKEQLSQHLGFNGVRPEEL